MTKEQLDAIRAQYTAKSSSHVVFALLAEVERLTAKCDMLQDYADTVGLDAVAAAAETYKVVVGERDIAEIALAKAQQENNRLQDELDTVNNDIFMSEKNLQVAFEAAYKRGAEAMRETAAIRIDGEGINGVIGPYFGNIIRAIPIPEDK